MADVAVSISDDTDFDSDPAAVLLLQNRLDPFADLWEIARSHEDRLRALQRFILVPNLLCVVGAFFFGATALTAVLVSNLGTFGLYSMRSPGPAIGRAGRPRSKPGSSLMPLLSESMSMRSLEGQDDGGLRGRESCRIDAPAPGDPPSVRIQELPREVGAMLVSVGVLGSILPGMIGTPALIAGGLVLWPKALRQDRGVVPAPLSRTAQAGHASGRPIPRRPRSSGTPILNSAED